MLQDTMKLCLKNGVKICLKTPNSLHETGVEWGSNHDVHKPHQRQIPIN